MPVGKGSIERAVKAKNAAEEKVAPKKTAEKKPAAKKAAPKKAVPKKVAEPVRVGDPMPTWML